MTSSPENYKSLKISLKKTNTYKQLTDLINAILLTEVRMDYKSSKKVLPAFKKLLCDIVDKAWKSTPAIIETLLPKSIKMANHIISSPKFRNHKRNENQLAWSSEVINQSARNKIEDLVISEFSHIKGPASFGKSVREINKTRQASPGPSCYFYDILKHKPRSPRIVFPRSAVDRSSYIPASPSPGPSKYYTKMHSISKHS